MMNAEHIAQVLPHQASAESPRPEGVGGRSPPGWVGGDAAQPRRGVRGRSPLEPHKRATPARLALCEPCPRDAPSVRRAPLNHAKAPCAHNYKGTQNKNRVMGFERAEDLTSLGIFAYGEVPTGDTCLHDALRGLSGSALGRRRPHFILNCSSMRPAWQCVIAQAMASAASSGLGIVSMFRSIFTICWICFLSALP